MLSISSSAFAPLTGWQEGYQYPAHKILHHLHPKVHYWETGSQLEQLQQRRLIRRNWKKNLHESKFTIIRRVKLTDKSIDVWRSIAATTSKPQLIINITVIKTSWRISMTHSNIKKPHKQNLRYYRHHHHYYKHDWPLCPRLIFLQVSIHFTSCMYVCMYPSGRGPAYSGPICWGLYIAGPLR